MFRYNQFSQYFSLISFQLRLVIDPRNPARAKLLEKVETSVLETKENDLSGLESAEMEDDKPMTPSVDNLMPYTMVKEEFQCKECKKVYKKLGSLKTHLEKNHKIFDTILFICKKCTKKFDTQKQLSRHENSKSGCCS